jgi:hypothetical protein
VDVFAGRRINANLCGRAELSGESHPELDQPFKIGRAIVAKAFQRALGYDVAGFHFQVFEHFGGRIVEACFALKARTAPIINAAARLRPALVR